MLDAGGAISARWLRCDGGSEVAAVQGAQMRFWGGDVVAAACAQSEG
jgi:hypothetical protein